MFTLENYNERLKYLNINKKSERKFLSELNAKGHKPADSESKLFDCMLARR